MKVLLVALALTVMGGEVLAVGSVWGGSRVVVYDFTHPLYEPIWREIVTDHRRIAPKRAPKPVYRDMATRPCAKIKRKRHLTGIVLCNREPGGGTDVTVFKQNQHVLTWAVVKVSPPLDIENAPLVVLEGATGHEFAHALYNAGEAMANQPPVPGGEFQEFARRVYRKHGRR